MKLAQQMPKGNDMYQLRRWF